MKKNRRVILIFISFMLLNIFIAGCSNSASEANSDTTKSEEKVVRIGYQKNGPLFIVKSLGTLDQRLEELGYKVEWKEFQDGPSLLEALNAGSIDFGRVGNTPPIFSQASGSTLKYVAAGASKYEGSGILVSKDSSIKSLEDLKGKKVAFSKGSSSHYLIVKALEKAGLTLDDIEPVYLAPGNARVAFEQGQVDAWAVWDPYTASTEVNSDAKLLVNGEGLTTDRDFFVASEKFASNQQAVIKAMLEEITDAMDWANNNHQELIDMLAKALKMDTESVTKTVERRVYGVEEITDEIVTEQQEIADLFYQLKIIPKKITVSEAMNVN
ncbi:sulfonate ABC transporter substrate-binding protein [Bacillus sp. USDA818B3_A]|uniref:sulfonate ABC transporter substrate-binding protein n=1 Tax=Bacillus sp. USDA818B3_A TaxID=2698834 RepID=UPI001F1DF9CF|nr:sulfonate ABC transporter substrate-binding protein [Bacillus sp. USDA818B3_A]